MVVLRCNTLLGPLVLVLVGIHHHHSSLLIAAHHIKGAVVVVFLVLLAEAIPACDARTAATTK